MFKFKQFTIHQDRTAMKVGTDGVLLGAWAPIDPNASRILDIGTGTGLIALMIAQRLQNADNKLEIVAIDIDQTSIEQATENVINSPFARYITTHHTSLQNHNPEAKYDAIVCNPPYFVASLKCPDVARTQARHTDSLSFDDLLDHSSRLLNLGGSLSVVLPINEGNLLIKLAPKYGFSLSQLVHVHPTPTSAPKRLLMHFVKQLTDDRVENTKDSHLTIEIARHQYTPEYIALTRDFYLKM
jgi:tRNA1Val (adenine37-N6)-methyltransferase